MPERVTAESLRIWKAAGQPISGLTAYDYPTAVLVDTSGIDLILVGDSLGQLVLGHARIEETTLDEMIHHCGAVSRAARRALVVGDMPFGSYEIDPSFGVHNAVRLVKEGGVDAVKVEGGLETVPVVAALSTARISTFAHLTLRHIPPTARTRHEQAMALAEAAVALEDAGACAVVLVGLPVDVAAQVTHSLREIPSIGYQSGPTCDGHLFVTPVLLGLLPAVDPSPGPYAAMGAMMREAFVRFRNDIAAGYEPDPAAVEQTDETTQAG